MTMSGKTLTPENIVEYLGDVFGRRGEEEYLGEAVTMAQHMLQSAALAEKSGENEQVIVAALLHDVGHFTSEFGMFSMEDKHDRFHEHAGAVVLKPFFPSVVVDCVQYHVAAKRYLCATDADYLEELSDASKHSLKLQGGPMNAEEVALFRQQLNLDQIVRVRHYDDQGKDPGMDTPSFSYYLPMLTRVVADHSGR